MKEKIKKNYKALTAFTASFLMLLGVVAGNDAIASAFPDQTQWLVVVGIPAVTAFFTWLKRNEPTVNEAIEILDRTNPTVEQATEVVDRVQKRSNG